VVAPQYIRPRGKAEGESNPIDELGEQTYAFCLIASGRLWVE
jgi:hypothetical protein